MPATPSSQPLITLPAPSLKRNGFLPTLLSNFLPSLATQPRQWTPTSSPFLAPVPVPPFRSSSFRPDLVVPPLPFFPSAGAAEAAAATQHATSSRAQRFPIGSSFHTKGPWASWGLLSVWGWVATTRWGRDTLVSPTDLGCAPGIGQPARAGNRPAQRPGRTWTSPAPVPTLPPCLARRRGPRALPLPG